MGRRSEITPDRCCISIGSQPQCCDNRGGSFGRALVAVPLAAIKSLHDDVQVVELSRRCRNQSPGEATGGSDTAPDFRVSVDGKFSCVV